MNIFKAPGFIRWACEKSIEAYRREAALHRFRRDNPTVTINEGVVIRTAERLRVGKNVIVDAGCLLHCGGREWSGGRGCIVLGDNVYVGPHSILFGAGEIEVGNDVLISPGVVIASHQHSYCDSSTVMRRQPMRFGRIVVEDDVWIGANAVLLPGASVGRGSVVGAGAVVRGEVPPFTVYAGVPAKMIKKRERDEEGK